MKKSQFNKLLKIYTQKYQSGGPLEDFLFTPEELKENYSVYKEKADGCKSADCLAWANNYYNTFVAQPLGIASSWQQNENAGISSGKKHDRYSEYGESADSWDIHGLLQEKGARQAFKGQERLMKLPLEERKKKLKDMNLPVGTIVGWGQVHVDSYNKKKDLVSSKHTSRVVGYDSEGNPIAFDYGKLQPLYTESYANPEYDITNITVPKDVEGYDFSKLGKENKLETKPYTYRKVKYKGSASVDPDELDPFINNLADLKGKIAPVLNLTEEEYDELQKQAVALAIEETEGGNDFIFRGVVPSYLTDKMGIGKTKGITQINKDVLFGNKELRKKLELLGLKEEWYDPWNPKHQAIATVALLNFNKTIQNKNAKTQGNSELTDIEKATYQWNNPALLKKGKAQGNLPSVKKAKEAYNALELDEKNVQKIKDSDIEFDSNQARYYNNILVVKDLKTGKDYGVIRNEDGTYDFRKGRYGRKYGGNIPTSELGYKRNSPDKKEKSLKIDSNFITMEGVDFPVEAYPNGDNPVVMQPGLNYYFPNSTEVIEIPMRKLKKQTGGLIKPNIQKLGDIEFDSNTARQADVVPESTAVVLPVRQISVDDMLEQSLIDKTSMIQDLSSRTRMNKMFEEAGDWQPKKKMSKPKKLYEKEEGGYYEEGGPTNGDTRRSTRKGKKIDVYMDGSWHPFGDSSMQDFRQHKSEKRKEAFYARHKKNLQGDSPRAKAFRVYARKTWEEGGEIPVVPELYNGTIEVENNETVKLPNGTLAQFKGKDHEDGGIPTNLPGGSFIFSEHLKAPKELKEALGIRSKKKLSYADLSKKYPTKGLMEFLDESTDEFRRATKEIELSRNLANLNLIAETQEAMKTKFKNGGKYRDGGPRGIIRPDGSVEYLEDSFPTVWEEYDLTIEPFDEIPLSDTFSFEKWRLPESKKTKGINKISLLNNKQPGFTIGNEDKGIGFGNKPTTVYEAESPLYNASIVNRLDPVFGQQMLKGIKPNPLLNLGKKKYSQLDYLTDDTKDAIPVSQQKEFFKPSGFKGIDRTGLVESQDYREPGFSLEPREDIPIGFDNQLTRDYLYNGERYDSEFQQQTPWMDGLKSRFNTAFDKTKAGVKNASGKLKNVGIDSTLAGTVADIALVAANKLKVEGPTLYDTTKKPIFSQYKRVEPKESQKALSLAINSLNNSNLPEQVKQAKIADLTSKFLDVQGQVDMQEAQRYQQFQDQNLSKLQSYMDINVDERYKNLDQYTREKGSILRQENKFKTWKNQQINNSIGNYFDYVDITNKFNQLFDRNYTVNPITGKVKFKEKPKSQLSSLSEQFKTQFAGNTMDLGNGLRGTVIEDPTTGKTQMFQFVQQTDGSYKLEPLFKQ